MADAQQRQVTLQMEDDQGSESFGDSEGESSCELNTGGVFDNEGLDQGEEVWEERKENGAKIIQVQGAPDGANGCLHQQDERCNEEEAIELEQVDGGKSVGEEQVAGEEQVDAAERKDEESDNNSDIIDLLDPQEEEGTDRSKREDLLLEAIGKTKYHKVEAKLTAKAVMNLGDNPLLSAIRFTEKLHDRADKNEPDKADFTDLANRVEEFTLRFLDPLKYDRRLREHFSANPHTDIILETAIKLKQKKFFDHPIIIDLMAEKWYGGQRYLKSSKLWWLFLNIWCLFDIVLFPLTFFALFIAVCIQACSEVFASKGSRDDSDSQGSRDDSDSQADVFYHYVDYFTAPYFIFVRDMLSYLTFLGLHLAVCLEPSQLPFSPLEWVILVFFVGRLFMEVKQLIDLAHTESERERNRSVDQKKTIKALTKYLRYSQRLPSTKDKSTKVKALINYFRYVTLPLPFDFPLQL